MRTARKLLALAVGIGLLAVLTVSAGTASAESPGIFEAENYPVYLRGTQQNTHEFKITAGTVTCKAATFQGGAAAAAMWQNMTAAYSECTAFGFPATVAMRSCEYEFNTGAEFAAGEHEGTVDVIDRAGAATTCAETPIRISAGFCVVTIGPQAGLTTLTYVNGGTGTSQHIKLVAAITGIEYVQGAGCMGGAGMFANGQYTGKTDVKGYINEARTEQQGIWVN